MKKKLTIIFIVIISIVLFTACPKPEISVAGIELNKNELSLTPGDLETLIATIYPEDATNKEVTWASSNSEVATVNNVGLVTAVSGGKADIIVTTEDGKKTATCKVAVKEPDFIVVTYDPPIPLSTQQGYFPTAYSQFSFDIDQDGVDDIRFRPVNQSGHLNMYLYYDILHNDFLTSRGNKMYFYYGEVIDENLKWTNGSLMYPTPRSEPEQFLAIKIVKDGNIHYGWVSVITKDGNFNGWTHRYYIIEKHAFCKIPNHGITAGQVE